MKNRGIAVAGSILVDSINTIGRYPGSGELTQISSVEKATGGCVPNVSIDLKRIDSSLNVYALGCVGDDEDGSFVREFLELNGVDSSGVRCISEKTSFTQVMSVSGGQRTFFTYAGASAYFGAEDTDLSGLDVDILHLGYLMLLDRVDRGDGVRLLQKARDAGIKTSIDLVSENSDRYKIVLPCLPFTDYLICNELEGGRIAGISSELKNIPAIAKRLLELGVREKVILHFSEGAICASKDGSLTLSGSCILPEDYIKGTTGAGDAFCAGALYAIACGLSDGEILEYGTVCATMALSSQDAVSAITDINRALESCRNYERRILCL